MRTSNEVELERRLASAVRGFGLEPEEVRWDRLAQLLDLWLRFGRAFNLSGARDENSLLEHVLEGLQVVALARRVGVAEGARWVDVGSGAGFPGLVVAACLKVELTLVEPRERRASFLDMAVHQIGRGDCRVLRGHVETSGWKAVRAGDALALKSFDWASARAVFAPEAWVNVARELLREGGQVVVHVQRDAEEISGWVCQARVDGERWSVRALTAGG